MIGYAPFLRQVRLVGSPSRSGLGQTQQEAEKWFNRAQQAIARAETLRQHAFTVVSMDDWPRFKEHYGSQDVPGTMAHRVAFLKAVVARETDPSDLSGFWITADASGPIVTLEGQSEEFAVMIERAVDSYGPLKPSTDSTSSAPSVPGNVTASEEVPTLVYIIGGVAAIGLIALVVSK